MSVTRLRPAITAGGAKYTSRDNNPDGVSVSSRRKLYSEIVQFSCSPSDIKQLLDEVFAISGIIKVEVTVIITVTSTLIIPDIAKTESNNCFIIHSYIAGIFPLIARALISQFEFT